MKLIPLFFMFFLVTSVAHSQVEIVGVVKDSSNIAIAYANVVLTKQDGKIISGTITNDKGYFKLEAEKDNYIINISYVGYETEIINITLNEKLELGDVILYPSKNELDEVIISSSKNLIEKKVDRLVFNVENSISASGGDVTDILKVAPYLRLRNDEIIMLGKSNIRVLVNGNLINLSGDDLTNYLKSIPSEEIQKIEIITNPPAKYEAEGNSGLINIIYKKGVRNSWRASLRGTYTQYTYPDGNIAGSFRYRKNKTSLYINGSYDKGSKLITDTNEFEFDDQLWDSENPRRVFYDNSVSTRIALNYQWSDRLSSGFQYQLGYDDLRIENKNDRTNIINKTTLAVDSLIISKSNIKQSTPLHSINFHTDYKLDSIGKNIAFNLDYFTFIDNSSRDYNSSNFFNNEQEIPGSFNAGKNDGRQNINNYSFKVDVEFPLKKVEINFGGKLSFINSDNDVSFFDTTTGIPILDLDQTNQFEYKETNTALYVSANRNFNDKWSTKIGLRLENTTTEGLSQQLNQTNENDYMKVFPSAYINYVPSEDHIFSLSYNKRISRPDFEYLNPFRITQNPFLFVEGNPFLQPSFSDNIELSYINKQKWVSSLYFSQIKDGFGQIVTIDNQTGIRAVVPQNYYDSYTVGLTESYTFNTWKKWESVNTLNINYSYTKSLLDFINDRRNGVNAYISTSNSFVLNEDRTIISSIDAWYNFPGVYDIYKTSSSYSVDVALKFFFLNRDLQLSVTGSDLFRSQITEVTAFSNGVRTTFENYYDSRRLRVSLRYNFGNKKINVSRKDFGNEEEKARTGN
ncbi:outer membrane beta-barrel family protein [Psychroserpens luteolus]|uniref:outer membrane beta-barrel family protein n=1 Tax=Psychroserpens luteolus TaxID=2855840 RepID=UPI001E59ECD8|nr:outer membrane beta-barrel family protein [Psychroserpens luteolus]MCD2258069.1 TonB-dependent receptor [Psychroserpens luteolus]